MDTMKGWRGKKIHVDLSSGDVWTASLEDYAGRFVGGRMLAARLYWDEVGSAAAAFDPENVLMLAAGPLAGTAAIACSRWVMCAKSPHSYPDQYGFGNGGGFFGAALKHAGFDCAVLHGKARSFSYLSIENGTARLHDASGLRGLTTDETIARLKAEHGVRARVVCIGPAGEHLVRFATAATEQGGVLSNGMGAVMGSKNLKAIVVSGGEAVPVADPAALRETTRLIRRLRAGQHASLYMTEPMIRGIEFVKATPCYGCPAGCMRGTFRHTSGKTEVRKTCAAAFVYAGWDQRFHGEATEGPFLATSLCDRLGLCTGEVSNLLYWMDACFQNGALTEDDTGLALSKIGSMEFFEDFVDTLVSRRGFGDLLARGTRRASIELGPEAEALALRHITPSGYVNDAYGARLFIANALLYATEPRNPIIQLHEFSFELLRWALWHTTSGAMSSLDTGTLRTIAARFWGDEKAVDFSTYDGKAQAAFVIQNRQHAKESMVACDRHFPILDTDQRDSRVGEPGFVPMMFSAVTGRHLTLDEYLLAGERSVNLQRAIMAREGRFGRDRDTIGDFNFSEPVETEEGMFGLFNPDLEMPGAGDEIISRKGAVLEREAFERMKDDYYALRGWDPAGGLQTREGLERLGLGFVCDELKKAGALAGSSGV